MAMRCQRWNECQSPDNKYWSHTTCYVIDGHQPLHASHRYVLFRSWKVSDLWYVMLFDVVSVVYIGIRLLANIQYSNPIPKLQRIKIQQHVDEWCELSISSDVVRNLYKVSYWEQIIYTDRQYRGITTSTDTSGVLESSVYSRISIASHFTQTNKPLLQPQLDGSSALSNFAFIFVHYDKSHC